MRLPLSLLHQRLLGWFALAYDKTDRILLHRKMCVHFSSRTADFRDRSSQRIWSCPISSNSQIWTLIVKFWCETNLWLQMFEIHTMVFWSMRRRDRPPQTNNFDSAFLFHYSSTLWPPLTMWIDLLTFERFWTPTSPVIALENDNLQSFCGVGR